MFQLIVIEGKTYYLIPQEFVEELVAGSIPKVEKPQEDNSLLNEFSQPQSQPVTAPQTGEIPIAQGKPSEYRQKFLEKRLGVQDVMVSNTANLSSLKSRQSKFDEHGDETSFDEVTF